MPGPIAAPKTLYDKVLQNHIVNEADDGTILIYVGKTPSSSHILSGRN